MYKTFIAVILTVVFSSTDCSSQAYNVSTYGKLIFSHVIFRHGDRTPIIGNFPTDPQPTVWPEGLGALTELGKKQHRELGKWIGKRYKNILISSTYNPNEIYVQSSDVNRTIESARANLEGLFSTDKNTASIQKIKLIDDYLIGAHCCYCPRYLEYYKDFISSPEYKKFDEEVKPLYDSLTAYTGLSVRQPKDIIAVYDLIVVKSQHGKKLQDWTKKFYPNNQFFIEATKKSFNVVSANDKLAKFHGGFLLKDILDRSATKFANQLYPNRNLWIYSTHDSVIQKLLRALRIHDNKFVEYAACVLIELRVYGDDPYFEIFYKNPSELVQLSIPNCGYSCPLYAMYILYGNILPKYEFNVECKL